jgi:hypothetical protein
MDPSFGLCVRIKLDKATTQKLADMWQTVGIAAAGSSLLRGTGWALKPLLAGIIVLLKAMSLAGISGAALLRYMDKFRAVSLFFPIPATRLPGALVHGSYGGRITGGKPGFSA